MLDTLPTEPAASAEEMDIPKKAKKLPPKKGSANAGEAADGNHATRLVHHGYLPKSRTISPSGHGPLWDIRQICQLLGLDSVSELESILTEQGPRFADMDSSGGGDIYDPDTGSSLPSKGGRGHG
jgi:hypothetical protein